MIATLIFRLTEITTVLGGAAIGEAKGNVLKSGLA